MRGEECGHIPLFVPILVVFECCMGVGIGGNGTWILLFGMFDGRCCAP